MKKFSRIYAFVLIIALFLSFSAVGYAEYFPTTSIEQSDFFITDNNQIVYHRIISPEEVPEGIVPLNVDSIEEAETIISAFSSSGNCLADNNGGASFTAISGPYDVELNRTQYGGILTSGLMVTELRVSYNIVNNKISNAEPYSSTYGIPAFADYTEESCTGYIVANTQSKEYYAITKGQLDYYIIFEGIMNLYTTPVSLEGQKNLVD